MQGESSALTRRLTGALLLSVVFHAALIVNVKPVAARYAGGASVPIYARLAGATPDLPGTQRVLALAAPGAAAAGRGAEGSALKAVIDGTLLKSYLSRREPRPGNLPDGRNAKVEIDLALLNDYYRARELDRRAEPLEEIPLTNPAAGPGPGKSARVILLVLINEDGGVDSVATLEAPPWGSFGDLARAAFAATRFSPALKDGRPVKSQKIVEILYGS